MEATPSGVASRIRDGTLRHLVLWWGAWSMRRTDGSLAHRQPDGAYPPPAAQTNSRCKDDRDTRPGGVRPGPRTLVGVAMAALVTTSVVACVDTHIADAVWVKNHTPDSLHFELVAVDGRRFPLVRNIAPQQEGAVLTGSQLNPGAGLTVDRCTVGDLIALAPDGHEVTRHPPPLCAREVWVIEGPGSSEPTGPGPSP